MKHCFLTAVLILAQIDPEQTLREIKGKVTQSVSRLPNYLCTETVDRQTLQFESLEHGETVDACQRIVAAAAKSPDGDKLIFSDRLRLDVGLISQKEMYSWVGEGRFDDRSLSEIVTRGTTSTGAFSSFLSAIFMTDGPVFTFKGESQMAGRAVLEYSFVVPITRSGYIVSNQMISRVTGYTGRLLVDAKTLDLLKLEIRTDSLPPELGVCQSSTNMDYTQVRMSANDVLLPSVVDVRMLDDDGHESHNRTVFRGCHQFMGESKLIFDDQSSANASKAADARSVKLSARIRVTVALAQNIDPSVAATGDLVIGKLTKAVKDPLSQIVIPKGAKVNGRIVGLSSAYGEARQVELELKWNSIESDGVSYPVDLDLQTASSGSAKLPLVNQIRPLVSAMSREGQRGVGLFVFPGVPEDYRIPAGFEADWLTLSSK